MVSELAPLHDGGPTISDVGFDLLNKLLAYDPNRRISCEAALDHAFFTEFPPPKERKLMPTYPSGKGTNGALARDR